MEKSDDKEALSPSFSFFIKIIFSWRCLLLLYQNDTFRRFIFSPLTMLVQRKEQRVTPETNFSNNNFNDF